jgi:pseudaminic acid synthase
MGASHRKSLETALKIVQAAAEAGAEAIKLQTWHHMVSCDHKIMSGPWAGRQMRELYDECKLPWDWHRPIAQAAHEAGIEWFSTPFDEASVDFLETLSCPFYKIASFEITYLPLIRHAASTGKPIVISTGMATEAEIAEAVETATVAGAKGITLLKCVSAYPAPIEQMNLVTMAEMRYRFGCDTGLSDHTLGATAAIVATSLGATMIEKHIAVDRDHPDGEFATMPHEFRDFVREVRSAARAYGEIRYGPMESERASLQFRRGIWVKRFIAAGERFTVDNIGLFRPRGWMGPERWDEVLRMEAAFDLHPSFPLEELCIRALTNVSPAT